MATASPQNEVAVMAGANKPRRRSAGGILVWLIVLLILATVLSWSLGSYSISLSGWWKALTMPSASGTVGLVLFQVRLPRILACILIGAGLSLAGAAYQGLFNNPMVSPDILGASAGAGFGAAIGILCGLQILEIQALSFAVGLLAVLLACALAAEPARRGDPVLVLVLVGILVASVFTALISITKYVADPYNKLPVITFWLLGSLASINAKDVEFACVPMILGSLPLFLLRWKLNVLSFGEEEAQTLGLNTRRLRLAIIVCSTLITAAAVSIAGIIGWIGLVIPHLARMLVGPNHKVLLPASAIIGACFLLLVDDIARTAFPLEMPVGILSALIGAPFFLYLLIHERKVHA